MCIFRPRWWRDARYEPFALGIHRPYQVWQSALGPRSPGLVPQRLAQSSGQTPQSSTALPDDFLAKSIGRSILQNRHMVTDTSDRTCHSRVPVQHPTSKIKRACMSL